MRCDILMKGDVTYCINFVLTNLQFIIRDKIKTFLKEKNNINY